MPRLRVWRWTKKKKYRTQKNQHTTYAARMRCNYCEMTWYRTVSPRLPFYIRLLYTGSQPASFDSFRYWSTSDDPTVHDLMVASFFFFFFFFVIFCWVAVTFRLASLPISLFLLRWYFHRLSFGRCISHQSVCRYSTAPPTPTRPRSRSTWLSTETNRRMPWPPYQQTDTGWPPVH